MVKEGEAEQLTTGNPCFIVLLRYWSFTNWRFVATLCWANLLALFFQQHLLISWPVCMSHFSGSCNISTFSILSNFYGDQWTWMFPLQLPGGGHGNPLQYSCQENPHGQRSLVDFSPWGHKESDMTEQLSTLKLLKAQMMARIFRNQIFSNWNIYIGIFLT